MRPYYQQDGVTIYHGDCADVIEQWEGLRTKPFDLLLTDPPYGIGRDGKRGSNGGHGGRKPYEFLGWDSQRPSPQLLARLIGISAHQIIWGGNYFVESIQPSMKWLVWDKGQRINQSDGELAWTSMDGALRIFTINRVELMKDGAVHPTQKPEELMRLCIGEVPDIRHVLDPFMGSGTTLVAAKRLGKYAVGIDREERYCEIAAKRLAQRILPLEQASTPPEYGLPLSTMHREQRRAHRPERNAHEVLALATGSALALCLWAASLEINWGWGLDLCDV